MLKAEAHAVGGRPARAGQFAAQMRMLHKGEAVMSLHPSRHAQCSGHLARSLSPQHLELLASLHEELPGASHNLRARRPPEGVNEVWMAREAAEARDTAVVEVACRR